MWGRLKLAGTLLRRHRFRKVSMRKGSPSQYDYAKLILLFGADVH